jgi:hypothetical protein
VFRNSDDNRSLEGGGPTRSVGAATAVAMGVGATTVVALGAEAVTGNHVSDTPFTDLNEVSTELMDNDLEANNFPREGCNNDGMSSDYPTDYVPDATETEYADASPDLKAANPNGSEDLMADSLGDNMDSNGSHSYPDDSANSSSSPEEDEEDEEENEWKQVGWVGAKGVLTHAGYGMLAGATAGAAAIGSKILSGGGDPVDEDDAVAAHTLMSGGEGGGGPGGNTGGQVPVTTTVVP